MTRAKRETASTPRFRRRLRDRTSKWENIGGIRVQAIRRLEPDRCPHESIVPAADARDVGRLRRHLFQLRKKTKISFFSKCH